MLLIAAVSLAMMIIGHFAGSGAPLSGDMGVCLPSPNMWALSPLLSWLLNLMLTGGAAMLLYVMNKEHNVVGGSDTVLIGMFALITASNPWVSGILTSSVIMVAANIACLTILFGCYRKPNATQELFKIATILSLGSMIQYAFIFLIPVYVIGAILMKCLRFKGILAIGMGLIAPYWVGIGLGVIPFDAFTMPTFTNLFDGYATKGVLFAGMLSIGCTTLLWVILALYNGVKLYAGNTKRRLENTVINVLGVVTTLCMLIDFNNLLAYEETIYMIAGVQLANVFSLWNIRHGGIWMLLLGCGYLSAFIFMIFI